MENMFTPIYFTVSFHFKILNYCVLIYHIEVRWKLNCLLSSNNIGNKCKGYEYLWVVYKANYQEKQILTTLQNLLSMLLLLIFFAFLLQETSLMASPCTFYLLESEAPDARSSTGKSSRMEGKSRVHCPPPPLMLLLMTPWTATGLCAWWRWIVCHLMFIWWNAHG